MAVLVALAAGLLAIFSAPASAVRYKSIWGPIEVGGVTQFPIYERLGVGIYQMSVNWSTVAPVRPADATDPTDPAYRWPREVDEAIGAGQGRGIEVSLLLNTAPGWANGGRTHRWAPKDPGDFADFAAAAARRYPGVRHWMIWGEPSKPERFQPLAPATGRRLTSRQKRGPRRYARILDASYAALKEVDPRNLVIGGNTWTAGGVVPLNFIRAMRLPSGRRPRMDLFGHNPFTARKPDLRSGPLRWGTADFSDLDTLAGWLDRYGYRDSRGRRLRLFLSELSIPTDHPNWEFNFWVKPRIQAQWLAAALRITRRWRRIYTLGYLGLYDDLRRPDRLTVNRGLLRRSGKKKPAYDAFRRG